MAAYMVVEIEVKNPEKYERYKELAPRLVILEFPSMDRARAWWASKEYAEAKGLRQACAATEMVLLEGV